MLRQFTVALALCLVGTQSQAALQGRLPATPGGIDYQAYYDDVLDITWVADANLARSSGFDSDGLMRFGDANSWIYSLNQQNGEVGYLGVNDWRLPVMVDTLSPGCDFAYAGTDCGYNVQTFSDDFAYSEVAHLYYVTLGNVGNYDTIGNLTGCAVPPNYCLANTSPFSNVLPSRYWLFGNTWPGEIIAWFLRFDTGRQGPWEGFDAYAWAVRSGDIDSDEDGAASSQDNCSNVYNPSQLDADGDGYGNICDADLNNSNLTTSSDFNLLRSVLNQSAGSSALAAAADMNGSGLVTSSDFNLLRARLNTAPGPSGLHP